MPVQDSGGDFRGSGLQWEKGNVCGVIDGIRLGFSRLGTKARGRPATQGDLLDMDSDSSRR